MGSAEGEGRTRRLPLTIRAHPGRCQVKPDDDDHDCLDRDRPAAALPFIPATRHDRTQTKATELVGLLVL